MTLYVHGAEMITNTLSFKNNNQG